MVLTDFLLQSIAPFFPNSRFIPKAKIKSGYVKLVEKNLIEKFNEINLSLVANDQKIMFSKKFGADIQEISILKLNQFHYQWLSKVLLGNLNFVVSLCLSQDLGTRLIYPLSKDWIAEFNSQGVKTRNFLSHNFFKIFMLIRLIQSIGRTFGFLVSSFHRNKDIVNSSSTESDCLYLPNLQSGHLNGNCSDNLVGWLKKGEFLKNNATIVHSNLELSSVVSDCKNVNFKYVNLQWRWNSSITKDLFVRFILTLKCIKILAAHSNKQIAFLHLHEILLALYTLKMAPRKILKNSLFDQSQGSLLPLWASALSELECRRILFFYAIAAEPILQSGKEFLPSLFANSSWDEIWVIDSEQKRILQSVISKPGVEFKEIGVPTWINSNESIPSTKSSIALFDSEPQKNLFFLSPSVALGLYSEEFYSLFFSDILQRAKYYNYTILHKGKKFTNKSMEPFYQKIRDEMHIKYEEHYKFIGHNMAPTKLLKSCVAAICQPISTTALISRSLGKPTVFYDPLNKVSQSDRALRGISVLKSKDLDQWFETLERSRK